MRFAARFGFEIEAETFGAIRKHVLDIDQLSAERVRDELTKMLTEGAAGNAFRLLDQTWLLHKGVAGNRGDERRRSSRRNIIRKATFGCIRCMMLDGVPAGASPTLAWGVLLHDVGKPPTFRSAAETGDRIRFDGHVEVGMKMGEEICRRLKMSNDETEQIVALIANHMKFKDATQMRTATLKRFVRLPKFEQHMALHQLDCLSSHRHLDAYEYVQQFLAQTPPEQVRPPRLVTGDDLVHLGYLPGPKFSEILRSIEDAQLEGTVNTKEEALRLVEKAYAGARNG